MKIKTVMKNVFFFYFFFLILFFLLLHARSMKYPCLIKYFLLKIEKENYRSLKDPYYFIERIDIFFFWDKAAKFTVLMLYYWEREATEQRRCSWWRLERYQSFKVLLKTTAWCWRRWNLKLGCLVMYFKQQLSVFQQHYMYFYTFSHTYFQKIQITLLEQYYQTSLMIRNPIFMKA